MKDTVSHTAPESIFRLEEPTGTRVLELCQDTGMNPDRFLTALVSRSMDDMTREGILPRDRFFGIIAFSHPPAAV